MIATRLAVPLAAVAVAAFAGVPGHKPPAMRLTATRGALELVNSRDATAVFASANMKPGDSASGSVEVTNRGTSSARLFLRSSPPKDGPLGDVLQARIDEGQATIAAGTLEEIAGCHALGTLRPGRTRSFRFTAAWPAGARDNAYAGARVSVDERWAANVCPAAAAPRIRISHRRVVLVGGRAKARVRCDGDAGTRCAGSLHLEPRNGLRSRLAAAARAARSRFAIDAGVRRTVYVELPAATRAALRARRKVVAIAVLEPLGGGRVTRLITLISPAPRQKDASSR